MDSNLPRLQLELYKEIKKVSFSFTSFMVFSKRFSILECGISVNSVCLSRSRSNFTLEVFVTV